MASWPQIPAGTDVALVGLNDLTLRVDNNSDGPRTLYIQLTFIADGHEYPLTVDPLPTIQAGTHTDRCHRLPWARSAGQFPRGDPGRGAQPPARDPGGRLSDTHRTHLVPLG